MEKDFESRFMPNVCFDKDENDLYVLNTIGIYSGAKTFYTTCCGTRIVPVNDQSLIISFPKVSIYEAIPELVPDGMRYNKELDKLVPDVIEDKKSVTDEYFTGIDLKKEIINERENGFIKADLEKLDFSLVDPFAYSDLAFQLTVGAKKYSKDNWKKGNINIYLSALERHIQDIKKALNEDDIESLIDDTSIQHGGALLCNSMFIHYFIRQILKDKNVK